MKKAQAAMEYLMTYGWAILIIIVVVGALYGMGVFTIGGGVPCSPCFSYFAYVDHTTDTLVITNGPREITYSNVSGITCTTEPTGTHSGGATMTFSGCTIADEDSVTITYDIVGGATGHTDTATLHV